MGIISSEPAKEEEMSSLTARFVVRMRKRVAVYKDETTPRFGWKWWRRSSTDEEAHKD